METAHKITTVVMDKTGTITSGKPSVTDVTTLAGTSVQSLLILAASLEQFSEHPLAGAIMDYAKANQTPLSEVRDFMALPGFGVKGMIQGVQAWPAIYVF